MKERRKHFERELGTDWDNLNKYVKKIDIYKGLENYEVINNFNEMSEIKKKYILQFSITPIKNKKTNESGVICQDPFMRVPSFIYNEFSNFVLIASKDQCAEISIQNFSNKGKLIPEEKETPSSFINRMIVKMERLHASDLSISWNSKNAVIKYSIGKRNLKEEEDIISHEFAEKVRVSLVNLAYERPSEKMIDGKFSIRISGELKEYRLSSIETIAGNSISIRSYQKFDKNLLITDLGFTDRALKILSEIITDNKHGLFLVCGPTGSGKTTTLYTILQQLYNEKYLNIKTAEDPVEIQIDGIDQCSVNEHGLEEHKVTYTKLISKFMRQNPDLIMIGEIRDSNVANAAINAALTGHFTFSTLHTGNVESTFSRLINALNVGVDKIEDSMVGILNQKLVKKLCTCKKETNGVFIANNIGCEKCNHYGTPGYYGEVVATEIVSLKRTIENYKKENYKDFYSFKDCAEDLYKNGIIDKETKTMVSNLS